MSRRHIPLIAAALVLAGCAIQSTGTRRIGAAPAANAAAPIPREIIRRGHRGGSVEKVDESRQRLERAAASLGAELAHLDAKGEEHAEYEFRVPPEHLVPVMDSAAALGAVGERAINVDDVTDQVVDAQGRLASLRASRDRLRALMEHADGVTDVITVERELARVQGEIESLENRLAALQGQVAMSELKVRLDRRHVLGPIAVVGSGIGKFFQKLFIWR